MRGKHQIGRLAGHTGVNIPARASASILSRLFHGGLLDCPATPGEKLGQKIAYRALVVGGGLDFAQAAGKPDGIKFIRGKVEQGMNGHDVVRISHKVFALTYFQSKGRLFDLARIPQCEKKQASDVAAS